MIRVKNLVKNYTTGGSEIPVLNTISLLVEDGEFVAIIGKSGSGKSTLLYQMSLLDTPTRGTVYYDSIDTGRFNETERVQFRLNTLGYVFQEYALLPSLTAIENVMTPLLMMNKSFQEAKKDAQDVLTRLGLGDKCSNLPNQLSGGQQQRVAIARAIVHKPKILYADEPTANLDTALSRQVLDIFLDLHRKGQTIVLVTHEPDYAKLAGRIITLSDGSISHETKTSHRHPLVK